jgi:hypothetical protein
MGLNPEAWLREQQKNGERWYRRKTADIDAAKRNFEEKGQEFWNNGTRLGNAVAAETQQKLQQIGQVAAREAQKTRADISGIVTREPASQQMVKTAATLSKLRPPTRQDVKDRVGPVLRGASDGATFGLGDRVSAAVRSGVPFTDDWGEHYAENMKAERAQDAFDQQHFPVSRGAGQVAGAVGSMLLTGPAAEIALGSRLVAGLAPRTAALLKAAAATRREAPLARGVADHLRWSSYAAGGGAALGGGSQLAVDAAQGRLSAPKDVAAAMVGGAADGVGTMYLGPARGGAIGGGTTAAAGDLLDGQLPSVGHVLNGAHAGYLTGNVIGTVGKIASQALPSNIYFNPEAAAAWRATQAKRVAAGLPANKTPWLRDKGSLGDRLSEMRSRLEFEGVGNRQTRFDVSKRYTVADHVTDTGRPVEAKFGAGAKLSRAQRLAAAEFDGYRVDHFLPRDIGKLLALPITAFANPLYGSARSDRR